MKKQVLVVDDSRMICVQMKNMLSGSDFLGSQLIHAKGIPSHAGHQCSVCT